MWEPHPQPCPSPRHGTPKPPHDGAVLHPLPPASTERMRVQLTPAPEALRKPPPLVLMWVGISPLATWTTGAKSSEPWRLEADSQGAVRFPGRTLLLVH